MPAPPVPYCSGNRPPVPPSALVSFDPDPGDDQMEIFLQMVEEVECLARIPDADPSVVIDLANTRIERLKDRILCLNTDSPVILPPSFMGLPPIDDIWDFEAVKLECLIDRLEAVKRRMESIQRFESLFDENNRGPLN